jgi:hypothetical protein
LFSVASSSRRVLGNYEVNSTYPATYDNGRVLFGANISEPTQHHCVYDTVISDSFTLSFFLRAYSEQYLDAVLFGIGDLYFVVDPNGNLKLVNI